MIQNQIAACKAFLGDSLSEFDVKEVLRYFLALNKNYLIDQNHMPLPLWREKGFMDQGDEAWVRLQKILAESSPHRKLVIYLHVPFCPSRCRFCDCLTMQLKNHVDRTLDQYLVSLIDEITAWHHCGQLSERPVTTVHFGGGTPLFLGMDRFTQLVGILKSSFNVHADTEWALETTCASLNTPVLDELTNLGFRRLHLGVQTMEDNLRPVLKRRESRDQILEKIIGAQARGWVTSVDLLVGLPNESVSGMLDGINALAEAGTDGFSIYEMNISSQNIRFAEEFQLKVRDRRENYWLFIAAINHVLKAGYQKNLFNHFANERDENLYFTFPLRDEDCLAIGAYADGVFENYHYRHPDYRQTMQVTKPTKPALQGGIMRPGEAKRVFPFEIRLLSGEFSSRQFRQVLPEKDFDLLLQPWKKALLIEETGPGEFSLTPNGAWFSGNMVADLEKIGFEHA